MWQEAKKKELQERKLVRDLYRDLIGQVNTNEHSKKVGFNTHVRPRPKPTAT